MKYYWLTVRFSDDSSLIRRTNSLRDAAGYLSNAKCYGRIVQWHIVSESVELA